MADPVVHITAGVPDSGTGNITTLGQTLLDGANATLGVTTGAAVITDAAGTHQGYLRGLVKLLASAINVNGRKTPANSAPVVLASQIAQPVAASQSAIAFTGGGGGATGDWLDGVLIVPATTSPGAVSVTDGSGSAVTIFTGGASSVSNLVPFFVPYPAASQSGAWKLTTGSNVSAVMFGNPT